MGKLQNKIESELRSALKQRLQIRLDVLRMLKADLQYEMNKSGAKDLSDESVQAAVKRAAKKRTESIQQYEKADRKDLLEKEKAELTVLEEYLPPPVPETEIQAIIEELCGSLKPSGEKDLGKVMGAVMGRLKGRGADGSHIRQLLLKKLGG